MQTECPHCHTIFRVQESDLEIANGQVRCGHCLAVFSADNPYNTTTYEDNELETIDSDVPSLQTETPVINDQQIIPDVVPPELRAESRKGKSRFTFIGSLLLTIAILLSVLAGITQYAYYNRGQLVKMAELRPWLNHMCNILQCSLPAAKDTSLIVLSSKNIYTHPNAEAALMISATIINQADFAQELPIIELRFENVRGKTIAGRRFHAEEYLGIPAQHIQKMEPNSPINFNLEIKDPGSDIVSYEFSFL